MTEHVKNCLVIQYANGTQFLHAGSIDELATVIHNTQETLKHIKSCFSRNALLMNSSKTQCIFIGDRQFLAHIPTNTEMKREEDIIKPRHYVNNFGVHIDRYMLLDIHLSEVTKNAIRTLMFINRNTSTLDKSFRIIAVQSLVLSIINHHYRLPWRSGKICSIPIPPTHLFTLQ